MITASPATSRHRLLRCLALVLTVWVPDLKASGVKVGVNWSGKRAVGYDIDPEDVVANVSYYIAKLTGEYPDPTSGAEPIQ